MYGKSGQYWDSSLKEAKESYYWGSEKVQEVYSKEEVKSVYLEDWDVRQDIDSVIDSVVASTMMKDLSYIMIRTDENGNPIFVMDTLYQLLLEDTKVLSSDNNYAGN